MLDEFLTVSYESTKQASIRDDVVESLKGLPDDELHKIASGETKLAFHGNDDCWLDKFKGSPLYPQALGLEEQLLQLDMQSTAQQAADREEREAKNGQRDAIWDARDAVRVKKRMLELEMRKSEIEGAGAEVGAEAPVAPEPMTEEAKEAAVTAMSASRGASLIENMRKAAAKEKSKTKIEVQGGGDGSIPEVVGGLGGLLAGAKGGYHGGAGIGQALGGPKGASVGRVLGTLGGAAAGGRLGQAAGTVVDRGLTRVEEAAKGKKKEAHVTAADAAGRALADMQKEAVIGAALKAAVPAVGKFLKGTAGRASTAYQKGGAKGLGTALKRSAKQGAGKAGDWASKNRGAAGVLGGAAIGTAGLTGAAVS